MLVEVIQSDSTSHAIKVNFQNFLNRSGSVYST